jgi:hypothetical protein
MPKRTPSSFHKKHEKITRVAGVYTVNRHFSCSSETIMSTHQRITIRLIVFAEYLVKSCTP